MRAGLRAYQVLVAGELRQHRVGHAADTAQPKATPRAKKERKKEKKRNMKKVKEIGWVGWVKREKSGVEHYPRRLVSICRLDHVHLALNEAKAD